MQVYKIFFRILNKQKGLIIMYLGIFLGIAAIVSSQAKENSAENLFESTSYKFTVFDEDNSEISKRLVKYLDKKHEQIQIEDDEEVIQDELYNRNTHCIIRIPKGFSESVTKGNVQNRIQFKAIPGTMYGENFQGMLNHYVSTTRSYMVGGFSVEEALEKTEAVCAKEVEVSVTDTKGSSEHDILYYFFSYLSYIMISICVIGIGPILIVFNKKEVRDRNNCSSYSLSRINKELFLGTITAGLGMCVCYCVMVLLGTRTLDLFSVKGGLYCLNMLSFMLFCLGLVFLIGQVVKKTQTLSMISNVVALGMSFLCGVFVPIEFLGDGIVRAAHFLPAYWNVTTAAFVDSYVPGMAMGSYWMGLGIQILFGVALAAIGLAYSKAKR